MIAPVAHTGRARLGARVRPGWFAQTHEHPELVGRTLLDILWRGDEHREGLGREPASRALDRYELAHAAEQRFESLSGGQQARLQILLLELSGATMLLLDEPTDNLDLVSAEALEEGLAGFDGTVVAVTHDRWFARGFDRFLVFGADGGVYESDRAGLGRGPGAARPVTPCKEFQGGFTDLADALRCEPVLRTGLVWSPHAPLAPPCPARCSRPSGGPGGPARGDPRPAPTTHRCRTG